MGSKQSCCNLIVSFFGNLDYLDDYVNNRIINVSIICSVFGPFTQSLLQIYGTLENPLLLFIYYYILAFIACFSVLIPAAMGNKMNSGKISKPKIYFSIMCLISLLSYEITSIVNPAARDTVTGDTFFYMFTMYTCSLFAAIAIINYLYVLYKPPHRHKKSIFATQKFNSLNSLNNSTKSVISSTTSAETPTSPTLYDDDTAIEFIDISKKGSCYLIKQFFWPTFDHEASNIDKERLSVIYPSRLYAAVYLALLGIIAIFEIAMTVQRGIEPALANIKEFSSTINDNILLDDATKNSIISVLDVLYDSIDALRYGVFIGAIVGLMVGVYSSMIVFKAFKKKVIQLREKKVSFNYNKDEYPVWYSTKFISTLASYLATASFMYTFMIIIAVAILGNKYFWGFLWSNYWEYLIGYAAYYAVEKLLIRKVILGRFLTDKTGSPKNKRIKIFQFILILSDMMYFPLAIFAGLFRMIFWNGFCILSYFRPDINVYPRGLEGYDAGHVTFVATVRLYVEREVEYVDMYPQSKEHHDGNNTVNNGDDLPAGVVAISDDIPDTPDVLMNDSTPIGDGRANENIL